MAADKKTTAKKTTAKEKPVSPHDTTPSGGAPNSFTKATRMVSTVSGGEIEKSALQPPRRVQPIELSDRDRLDRRARRQAYSDVVDNYTDSIVDAPIGYRWMEPERAARLGQSLVSDNEEERAAASNEIKLVSWLAGAHHAFPNAAAEANTPAIDEPHLVGPGTEVSRRWEDLSKAEVDKAHQVMDLAGMPSNRSNRATGAEALTTSIQLRNMMRVLGEHTASGVSENVSQKFYGGTPSTHIPDPDLRSKRDAAHSEAQDAFEGLVIFKVAEDPKFVASVSHLSTDDALDRARYIAAASVSRTSPNTPYKRGQDFPNLRAAGEVVSASTEGRALDRSALAGSRPANAERGVPDISSMIANPMVRSTLTEKPVLSKSGEPQVNPDFTVKMKPTDAPKTGPFLTAMSTPDAADAYTVTDVMESQQMMPWLTSAKGKLYTYSQPDEYAEGGPKDGQKKPPDVTVWGDRSVPRGFTPKLGPVLDSAGEPKLDNDKNPILKHLSGNNEAEAILAKGGALVHALNDKAARNVNAAMGISRGVNYADNVNQAQAARWGSEQALRESHFSSHADHYPVVRDWGSEGAGVSEKPEWLGSSSSFDWMYEGKSLSPQFTENPNTEGHAKSAVLRTRPYVV